MLKRLFQGPNQNGYPMPYPPQPPDFDINRLTTEINELKRMNNEMLKRIARLENYLGIREQNENLY